MKSMTRMTREIAALPRRLMLQPVIATLLLDRPFVCTWSLAKALSSDESLSGWLYFALIDCSVERGRWVPGLSIVVLCEYTCVAMEYNICREKINEAKV